MASSAPESPKVQEQAGSISLQAAAIQQTRLLGEAADIEWPGVRRSLQEVDQVTSKMVDNGLSQKAFFLGVINIALTSFVLGRWPEFLWVLYIAKVFVLIPAWFWDVSRRMNAGLWVLDFCWVSNILLGLYMFVNLVAGPSIGPLVKRWAWLWFFSTALGPLSWAVLLLGNGLVFHSIERSASLFIHLTPCLVAWTLRWSPIQMIDAWPDNFTDESLLREASLGEVYLAGITMYFCWLTMHALWLLTCGVNAPASGYSTVFDEMYKKHKLGDKFERKTGLTSVRAHAAIYLALHACACSIAFLWSMLCYKYWAVHTAFAMVLFLSVVWVGAGYYVYIFKSVYSKALHKLLPATES